VVKKEIEEMKRYKWNPYSTKELYKESKQRKERIMKKSTFNEMWLIMIAFIVATWCMEFKWYIVLIPVWLLLGVTIYFYATIFLKTIKRNIRDEQIAREEKEEESKKA
jgi:hypothetical protein